MFVLPQVYGPPGGIQRYNRALLKAAGEAFIRAEIAVASVNDERIPEAASVRGRVHFAGAGPRARFLHRAAFVTKALRGAWHHRPELIVCGHINLMPLVWCLGALFGARTTLVAYGIEAWFPARHRRWATRRADLVLPISRYTAARMKEWGVKGERVSVLSNPVDGDEFRPLQTKTSRLGRCLLTVARLDRSEGYKGVEYVLEALPSIQKRCQDVRYRVVGTGDDLPRLRALASDLGVEAHVDFAGAASDEELLRLYNDSDVFVMVSMGEGFGFVFLEALACGTPTIAGNWGGAIDALLKGQLGALVNPESREDLVNAIVGGLTGSSSTRAREGRSLRYKVLAAYGSEQFTTRVRALFVRIGLGKVE
jgi:glycosyltransferase involved in cell wall biosynthesis